MAGARQGKTANPMTSLQPPIRKKKTEHVRPGKQKGHQTYSTNGKITSARLKSRRAPIKADCDSHWESKNRRKGPAKSRISAGKTCLTPTAVPWTGFSRSHLNQFTSQSRGLTSWLTHEVKRFTRSPLNQDGSRTSITTSTAPTWS